MPELPPHIESGSAGANGVSVGLDRFWTYLRDEAAGGGLVRRLFELARDEDLGPNRLDATARVMFDPTDSGADAGGDAGRATARVVLREPGVVAGLAAIPDLIDAFADAIPGRVAWSPAARDSDVFDVVSRPGVVLGELSGDPRAIVTIERTLLNLLGRLSGIATRTARFVREVRGTNAIVLDTRKTTPGLRVFEKYAVRCGGGATHRLGLYDAVLIKDNHAAGLDDEAFGSRVEQAARRARAIERPLSFVEVEVDTLAQLDRVLAIAAREPALLDHVLLDNFSAEQLNEAVARRARANAHVGLEASGGVSLETIGAIARTGVDRISVGGLTHQATSLDVGLDRD